MQLTLSADQQEIVRDIPSSIIANFCGKLRGSTTINSESCFARKKNKLSPCSVSFRNKIEEELLRKPLKFGPTGSPMTAQEVVYAGLRLRV